MGHAIDQVVSRRPPTAEARALGQILPSSSVFTCQHNSTVALHAHISSGSERNAR
jgi:hypothetical protein